MPHHIDPDWAFPGSAPTGHFYDRRLPADLLAAVAAYPEREGGWMSLAAWLADDGHTDQAAAVRAFRPAVADFLRDGVTLSKALELVSTHSPALARVAGRIGDR